MSFYIVQVNGVEIAVFKVEQDAYNFAESKKTSTGIKVKIIRFEYPSWDLIEMAPK